MVCPICGCYESWTMRTTVDLDSNERLRTVICRQCHQIYRTREYVAEISYRMPQRLRAKFLKTGDYESLMKQAAAQKPDLSLFDLGGGKPEDE